MALLSCQGDDAPITLQEHIDSLPELTPFDELVACAGGGQPTFLADDDAPLNVFFYPELETHTIKYYETADDNGDPDDLSLYSEVEAEHVPIFNGFLRRFPRPAPQNDVYSRVSFINGDTLWYSKAIKMKINEQPSEFLPELCEVDLSITGEPIFTWEEGTVGENVIFFHAITTEQGDALSGTYTEEQRFQYYNLDNVVFNVTRTGQPQPLEVDSTYYMTLMGVSSDNWVNLFTEKRFTIE